ncbi:hypothetical protein HHK36_011159 [Tetracentron sinense]|uniref:Protein FAR1-RELATED SEQUENCE n=1 Tax=Tetracentron sinense TaxID=13715 RepID=A0A834ZBY3_TETSI|nr:hypothetical protein HHK36_011159 [Tetracentron sinense]
MLESIAGDSNEPINDCEVGNTMDGDSVDEEEINEIIRDNDEFHMLNREKSITIEPMVGMEFDSIDAVKKFYNVYAKSEGFSIRMNRSYYSKDRRLVSRDFVCSREGKSRKKIKEKTSLDKMKEVDDSRGGCQAILVIKEKDCGRWYISTFRKKHNHEMVSPSKVHLLRSHKRMSNLQKNLIHTFCDTGLGARQTMDVLINQAGGIANVGFDQRDLRNFIGIGRLYNRAEDAQVVYDYFKSKQSKDAAFFYAIQIDCNQCLSNVFWVDSKFRGAYQHFGDVVTFDTTYKKNMYLMSFAPFTGVNHHRQSILFGCALLADETEETFEWLFEVWLEAMSGKMPVSIITDQDKAMKAAIARVFPSTIHRFCKWHILNKVPEKLNRVYQNDNNFGWEFRHCIENVIIDDFKRDWKSLLEKYSLSDNEWIKSLYEERKHWIPAYMKETFFAGMSTSGRSESINSLFKGYVHSLTNLRDFVRQYDNALENRYAIEVRADFETSNKYRTLKTSSMIEKQAAEAYTKTMFDLFDEQYLKSLDYLVFHRGDEGDISYYHVRKIDEQKEHIVMYLNSETTITCSCKMFEFEGILCKHILSTLRVRNILQIPEQYLLKRWKRDSNKGLPSTHNVGSQQTWILRYNTLCLKAIRFAEEGVKNESLYEVALGYIDEAFKKMKMVNDKHESSLLDMDSQESPTLTDMPGADVLPPNITIHNPRRTITKGKVVLSTERWEPTKFSIDGNKLKWLHFKCNSSPPV